jgi:protein-disulfide isomerase
MPSTKNDVNTTVVQQTSERLYIWGLPMRFIRLIFAAAIGFAAMQSVAAPTYAADVPTLRPYDRILGNKSASITIFEYASLTCPHCAAFATDTLPKLKTDWIDSGKAKLVYRDYPLDQSAALAATIARCLPEDRFFPFIETLFKDQHDWVYSDPAASRAALVRLAGLGGMSEQTFNACASNQKLSDAVLNSRLVAQKQYGVKWTPTFFINGIKVEGDQPYSVLLKALNAASSKAATEHH